MFHENAAEAGLAWNGPPSVRRSTVEAPSGNKLSALVWGDGPPELVLLHGGRAERPHLGHRRPGARPSARRHRPARPRALRLAGRARLPPQEMADDVDHVDRRAGARRPLLAGMSLGGLTATVVAAAHPEHAAPPGRRRHHARRRPREGQGRSSTSSAGPRSSTASTRSSSAPCCSTRPGPSRRCAAASSTTPTSATTASGRGATTCRSANAPRSTVGFADLWDGGRRGAGPAAARAGRTGRPWSTTPTSPSCGAVSPTSGHVVVDDAGHSIQGDQPVVLARLLGDFLDG